MHEYFLGRCIELAKKGGAEVAPNPMVGAALVHDGEIIGEGYHQKFGEAHAEVNCINDALDKAPGKISSSTMYVSLEPCSHFGKTPPCTHLIRQYKIPNVVIGCSDSFEKVNGSGIEQLRKAGLNVITDVLKEEAVELNKRFFSFYQKRRPYITLKWAQTGDGFMASDNDERLLISNEITNRLVHKWRSEEAAIMIGANTALKDDPLLDNRYWMGRAPIKIILDPHLRLPLTLRVFKDGRMIIVNTQVEKQEGNLHYMLVDEMTVLPLLMTRLYESGIQSILVEGGRFLLQSLIDADLWDETRVIVNKNLLISNGLKAPVLSRFEKLNEEHILTDSVEHYKNINNKFVING